MNDFKQNATTLEKLAAENLELKEALRFVRNSLEFGTANSGVFETVFMIDRPNETMVDYITSVLGDR